MGTSLHVMCVTATSNANSLVHDDALYAYRHATLVVMSCNVQVHACLVPLQCASQAKHDRAEHLKQGIGTEHVSSVGTALLLYTMTSLSEFFCLIWSTKLLALLACNLVCRLLVAPAYKMLA